MSRFFIAISSFFEQRMCSCPFDIKTLINIRFETSFDKLFTLIRNWTFWSIGKIHKICLKHDSFVEDAHLTHLIPKRLLSIQHLKIDNADRPNVNFGCDHSFLFRYKTFWRQVPVCSYSLRCELNDSFSSNFTKPKISYFYFSFVEHNILRLQIIVNYFVR